MSKRKTMAEKIAETCVHFNGVQNRCCKAEVVYASVSIEGTGLRKYPCFKEGELAPCAKRRFPTEVEVKAEVDGNEACWENTKKAMRVAHEDVKAKKLGKGNGGTGVIPCPVCNSGELHYSVSGYNGHIRGRCTTPNCTSWMQ